MVSLLGVFGQGTRTTDAVLEIVAEHRRRRRRWTRCGRRSSSSSSLRPPASRWSLGILGALWSASGYVGAFGRAMNRIYEIDEGRPVWKLRPLQLVLTLRRSGHGRGRGVHACGQRTARRARSATPSALGDAALTMWSIVRWPVILVLVVAGGRVPLLRHTQRQAAEIPLDQRRRGVGDPHVDRGVGAVRASTSPTSAATTRRTARWPASSSSCCGCGSPIWRCCSAPNWTPNWSVDGSCKPGSPAERELQLPPRDTRVSRRTKPAVQEDVERAQTTAAQSRAAMQLAHTRLRDSSDPRHRCRRRRPGLCDGAGGRRAQRHPGVLRDGQGRDQGRSGGVAPADL